MLCRDNRGGKRFLQLLDEPGELACREPGAVQHDHHVFGVVPDVAARSWDRTEAESLVETVLAICGARGTDHRLGSQETRGTHGEGVQVDPQTQLARLVLHYQTAVLKRFRNAEAVLPEHILIALGTQMSPGLKKTARLRRRKPHVSQRWPSRLAPPDEVPGAEVQILIVGVAAVRSLEVGPAATVEQNPRPQLADPPDQLRFARLAGFDAERGYMPRNACSHGNALHNR